MTLREALGDSFLIGCSLDREPKGVDFSCEALAAQWFNAIVPGNCMKAEVIHPEADRYDWTRADHFVQFGQENGLTMTGHCLIWHSQTPAWLFVDERGNEVGRDTLIARMREHIYQVVGRYRGRLRGWDVVNEALLDDGSLRPTPWLRIIGPDYIELAFRFAHEADPQAELYYNDYSLSLPAKREGVVRIVRALQSVGCRIDAVGMQSHCSLSYPDLSDYEASIDTFAALGVGVMVTELDISVLPSPWGMAGADVNRREDYDAALNPYAQGLPAEVEQRFTQRYIDFFDIFRRHSHQLRRVTLWGVTDADSWLNNWPIPARTDYPLLFDRQGAPKPVVNDIVRLFQSR